MYAAGHIITSDRNHNGRGSSAETRNPSGPGSGGTRPPKTKDLSRPCETRNVALASTTTASTVGPRGSDEAWLPRYAPHAAGNTTRKVRKKRGSTTKTTWYCSDGFPRGSPATTVPSVPKKTTTANINTVGPTVRRETRPRTKPHVHDQPTRARHSLPIRTATAMTSRRQPGTAR